VTNYLKEFVMPEKVYHPHIRSVALEHERRLRNPDGYEKVWLGGEMDVPRVVTSLSEVVKAVWHICEASGYMVDVKSDLSEVWVYPAFEPTVCAYYAPQADGTLVLTEIRPATRFRGDYQAVYHLESRTVMLSNQPEWGKTYTALAEAGRDAAELLRRLGDHQETSINIIEGRTPDEHKYLSLVGFQHFASNPAAVKFSWMKDPEAERPALRATINWEDGWLRLYCEGRVPADDYQRVRDQGFNHKRGETTFSAPWTTRREDFLRERFGVLELHDDDRDLLADAEARAEKYAGYSENAQERSDAARDRSASISSFIPFGQPILIGHHSERKHRRDLDKMHALESKRFEEADKAAYWAYRAERAVKRAAQRQQAPQIHNRISELEAGLRRTEREFAKTAEWDLINRTHWQRWQWYYTNRLDFERALLASLPQDKQPVTDFEKGGGVLAFGQWNPILRVNAKTVTVAYTNRHFKQELKIPKGGILPENYRTAAQMADTPADEQSS
jgi:hypothetical protein